MQLLWVVAKPMLYSLWGDVLRIFRVLLSSCCGIFGGCQGDAMQFLVNCECLPLLLSWWGEL